MSRLLHQIDKEMPEEPSPEWTCSICGESYQSERIFKLHDCQKGEK